MAGKKFLSVHEASEQLKLPEKKVRKMIRDGELRITRIGYNMAVDVKDVEKLAATLKAG